MLFVTVILRRRRINRRGLPYGWPISVYTTPEALWGCGHVTTSTLQLKREDLLRFVESTGHSPIYVDLPDPRMEDQA